MAIDARITGITIIRPSHCGTCDDSGKDPEDAGDVCPSCYGATESDPVVRLLLEPREPSGHPYHSVLTVRNPPTLDPHKLSALIGTEIWGGASEIMIGDRKWANRISYTQIELVDVSPLV